MTQVDEVEIRDRYQSGERVTDIARSLDAHRATIANCLAAKEYKTVVEAHDRLEISLRPTPIRVRNSLVHAILWCRTTLAWHDSAVSFSLWIETEHVIDPITDFCNVIVSFEGGTEWALNVWTFDFFATARNEPELAASTELAHTYMRPPDLFVSDLSRSTLERVVGDIVIQGGAPNHWRSEFSMDELSFGLSVKISDTCPDTEIAGRFGRLAGIARDPESDAVADYAVHIHDLDRVWSVDPAHLAPA